MADPGFSRGGATSYGERGLPRRLHFENFGCQNERIWTLSGGVRRARPLDPPMLVPPLCEDPEDTAISCDALFIFT